MLYLDFDRFKQINDTLGHGAGDEFLKVVAQRITGLARATDKVGRLGGDEFAVLINRFDDPAVVLQIAGRLQVELASPYALTETGSEVKSSASIGIAFSRPHYTRPEEILKDADFAMYRAKSAGRACTVVFEQSMREPEAKPEPKPEPARETV